MSSETTEKPSIGPEEITEQNAQSIKKKDIFVGNLSLYTNNDSLRQFFSRFGEIENVRVMFHPETRRSRRFGFITFSNEEAVKKLLNDEQKYNLDGKELDIRHAFKKSDEDGGVPPVKQTKKPFIPKDIFDKVAGNGKHGSKIFLGGISQELASEDLKKHFEKYGTVDRVDIIIDKETSRRKGFCFITFANEISATLACLNRYQTVQKKQVEVKRAIRRMKNEVSKVLNPAQVVQPLANWPNLSFTYWAPQVFSTPSVRNNRYCPYPTVNPAFACQPTTLNTPTVQGTPAAIGANLNQGLYPLDSLLQVATPYQMMPNFLPQNAQMIPPASYFYPISSMNPK